MIRQRPGKRAPLFLLRIFHGSVGLFTENFTKVKAINNHPFVLVFFVVYILRLWKTHFLERDMQVIGCELDAIVMTCHDRSGRTLAPSPCPKH